jgi:hypothetical protein
MIEDDGDLAPGFQHSSLGMVHSNAASERETCMQQA